MKVSCHLLVNENLFSYEGMSTRTCFEKEVKGNSEMAYDDLKILLGLYCFISSR